jgi:DNA replication protein DnaC
MSVIDELVPLLKKLRLSGVLQSLELRLREAAEDNLGYEEFLYRLVKDEVERRDAKQLDQRVRRANFEHQKTLEDFDFHFNPQVPKAKVLDLATCAFVERRENALLLGPTGVGKSHICSGAWPSGMPSGLQRAVHIGAGRAETTASEPRRQQPRQASRAAR